MFITRLVDDRFPQHITEVLKGKQTIDTKSKLNINEENINKENELKSVKEELEKMKNKYKTRLFHAKSESHKFIIRKNHLEE